MAVDRPAKPLGQVDASLVTKARDRRTGPSVEGNQVRVAGANEDPVLAPVGPVSDATMDPAQVDRCSFRPDLGIVHPQRLSGRCINSCHLAERRAHVKHPADHQWRCLVREGLEVRDPRHHLVVGRAPSPGHAELPNVVARDLIERGVARVGVRATVGRPLAERQLKLGGPRTRGPATRKDE